MIQPKQPYQPVQRPVIKFGRSTIQTAVWRNEKGYSVTLSKSHKDAKGKWQTQSITMFMNELQQASFLLDKTYGYLLEDAEKIEPLPYDDNDLIDRR